MPLRSYHSEIPAVALFKIIQLFAWTAVLLSSYLAVAQVQLAAPKQSDASPALVVGFVGGFVHNDDLRHAEVQIAQQIQVTYGNGVHVQIFENRRTQDAHKLILDWLSRERNGKLTDEEKRSSSIILFGHSWGASAVVSLARELQRDGIPVALTTKRNRLSVVPIRGTTAFCLRDTPPSNAIRGFGPRLRR